MVGLAADRRGKYPLAIDCDDEEMRGLVSLDADQPFGHRFEETARKDVFAVGGEVMAHQHATARAERQSFHVLGL